MPAPPAQARHRRKRVRSRPRLLVAAAIGIVAAVAIPAIRNPILRAVIGWDIGAAVFLASRASDFVNGQMLAVDGGLLAAL